MVGVFSLILSMAVQYWFDPFRSEFTERPKKPIVRAQYQVCVTGGVPFHVPIEIKNLSATILLDTVVHRVRGRLGVLLRYAEYSLSAPILYIAVLSVFAASPPSWTFVLGFAGVMLCNILGLCLHVLHVAEQEEPSVLREHRMHQRVRYTAPGEPRVNTWGRAVTAFFGFGTWHDPWVAKLELLKGSWIGLAAGIFAIVYVGRSVLFNPSIPVFVIFALWNLLITYCLFGIVGSVFYAYDWIWVWMEPALDVLSVTAKIPIAVSICLAFLQMPGGGCK